MPNPAQMKAISIRAPWWYAILHLGKDIENRDWYTNRRGRVLIHASSWNVQRDILDDLAYIERLIQQPVTRSIMQVLSDCRGHIVGSVEIVDCVQNSGSRWFQGKFGFVLKDPILFTEPWPVKGELGMFDVTLPEGFRAA